MKVRILANLVIASVVFVAVSEAMSTRSGTYYFYSDETLQTVIGARHIGCMASQNYHWGTSSEYYQVEMDDSCGQGGGCPSGTRWTEVWGRRPGGEKDPTLPYVIPASCISSAVCNSVIIFCG